MYSTDALDVLSYSLDTLSLYTEDVLVQAPATLSLRGSLAKNILALP